jgi:hypothetical protein
MPPLSVSADFEFRHAAISSILLFRLSLIMLITISFQYYAALLIFDYFAIIISSPLIFRYCHTLFICHTCIFAIIFTCFISPLMLLLISLFSLFQLDAILMVAAHSDYHAAFRHIITLISMPFRQPIIFSFRFRFIADP